MPAFAPKTSKKTSSAAILSWDAFPPPPPEAETWKPDPGSVPKPGALPDPRFNRDPEADRRSRSYRKEARMYGIPDPISRTNSGASLSSSLNGAAPSQSLGQWPAPHPRATGYPRDFVCAAAPPTPPIGFVTSAPPAILPRSPSKEPMPITLKKSTVRIGPVTKGTMETLVMPKSNYCRPQTPIALPPSTLSISPDKIGVPAWAAPLEKALAEDIRRASAESNKTDTTAGPRLNAAAKIYDASRSHQDTPRAIAAEKLVNEEVKHEDEALAWKIATTELGVEDVKQGLSLQAQILSAYTAKKPDVSAPMTLRPQISHEHKVKVIAIRAMEAELDLGKVATVQELMGMSENEIERFYERVCSAHKHWWEAEQGAHTN